MSTSPNPLAGRTYRRLFSAQVVALVGTGLSTVALALLAFDLAGEHAGTVLGTALALKMVAYVGFSPLFGAVARHVDRRRLLIGLDLIRAALIASLPLVTGIWQIYLLIFLLSICSAGFTPTFQATIPDVLPDEAEYTRALSLSRLAYDLENLLSPAIAAAALAVLSYDALFGFNALAFLISAALVFSVALPSNLQRRAESGVWQESIFGLRAYLRTPRLQGLLALSAAVSAAGAMVIVNTVVYVRHDLGGSESDTAVALAATGAGSMLVALFLPARLDRRPERRFMLAGGGILAAALILGVSQPGFLLLLPIWFLIGAGSSLIQTPAGRLLARSASEADRPAIYAAQFALSHLCWLISYPLSGWLVAAAGFPLAFGALSAVALIATLTAYSRWPACDPIELLHTHQPIDHAHEHIHDAHHQHDHEGWEGPEPHSHVHRHEAITHKHRFVVDAHHAVWPA